MARYLLGQKYCGCEPGEIVELEPEVAARLLSVTEIPDVVPRKIKPKSTPKKKASNKIEPVTVETESEEVKDES